MRRLFGLAAVLAAWALWGQAAYSQQIVSVSVKNMSYGAIYLTIHDDVCQRLVYRRRLANAATTTLRVCADRRGRARVSVYDYRGRRQTFKDVINGSTVRVRVR